MDRMRLFLFSFRRGRERGIWVPSPRVISWKVQDALILFPDISRLLSLSSKAMMGLYLTVILRGRAGYELIYITNEAVGRVGYYQLISGKSEKNNCFSKFPSNSLDFIGWNLRKSWHFLYRRRREKNFSDLQNFSTRKIRLQFFLIWSNLTIMAHMMGLGNQSESWKIIIMS